MKSKRAFFYGILLGIIGIVMFSSKAVMVKLAYEYKIDPLSILLLRMLFSFPFYLVIAYLYRNNGLSFLVLLGIIWQVISIL